jgi:hypothetical protein
VVEIRNEWYTECFSENPKVRDHLGDLCTDGRIMLKWVLKNRVSQDRDW